MAEETRIKVKRQRTNWKKFLQHMGQSDNNFDNRLNRIVGRGKCENKLNFSFNQLNACQNETSFFFSCKVPVMTKNDDGMLPVRVWGNSPTCYKWE